MTTVDERPVPPGRGLAFYKPWYMTRRSWQPEKRWRPYFGGDEWNRHTVVLAVPFAGYLVVPTRRCPNTGECAEMSEAMGICDEPGCGWMRCFKSNGKGYCVMHEWDYCREEEK